MKRWLLLSLAVTVVCAGHPAEFAAHPPGPQDLIAEGERLFFTETFAGNGRTCGTCHRAENNFTIDPEFIATLPPDDPLFVAEFNPDLAQHFENPTLMRRFGLILNNVDGFDDLANKFVMRGVPHLLGLRTSALAANPPTSEVELTGWSGDGATGDGMLPNGRLRDFAKAAVRQHLTKTLNRVEGLDFRLPTEHELDALEAFMLSLGRQEDPDLTRMTFRNPMAERGKFLFGQEGGTISQGGGAACSACHSDAGAQSECSFDAGCFDERGRRIKFGGTNFNTGVEDLPGHPARTVESFPRDGGFGREPNGLGGFGNGTFNVPSLVEAADTGPWFHNNAIAGEIEEAIAFYTSDTFANSPAGRDFATQGVVPSALSAGQIRALGAFLRVLNALENIRSVIAYQTRARSAAQLADAERPLTLAIHDIDDAIEVLRRAGLHDDAIGHLQQARLFTELAAQTPVSLARNALIGQAIAEEETARGQMVQEGTTPGTAPQQSARPLPIAPPVINPPQPSLPLPRPSLPPVIRLPQPVLPR
jgi:cytochrome c peroxidase